MTVEEAPPRRRRRDIQKLLAEADERAADAEVAAEREKRDMQFGSLRLTLDGITYLLYLVIVLLAVILYKIW